MMALRFLRAQNQHRSRFKFEGDKRLDGIASSLISFEERARPRLIASNDEAAARGRLWIDERGRVVRSELSFETGLAGGRTGPSTTREHARVRGLIRVSYGDEPRLKLWMPMSMDEEYHVGGHILEGHATYTNFRRFQVDTSTIAKSP
jgi:hypothetical protein